MRFDIEYFHERVLAEIESRPVDVLADFAASLNRWNSTDQVSGCRIRARMLMVSSNFACEVGQESAALSTVSSWDVGLSCCMHSSKGGPNILLSGPSEPTFLSGLQPTAAIGHFRSYAERTYSRRKRPFARHRAGVVSLQRRNARVKALALA